MGLKTFGTSLMLTQHEALVEILLLGSASASGWGVKSLVLHRVFDCATFHPEGILAISRWLSIATPPEIESRSAFRSWRDRRICDPFRQRCEAFYAATWSSCFLSFSRSSMVIFRITGSPRGFLSGFFGRYRARLSVRLR